MCAAVVKRYMPLLRVAVLCARMRTSLHIGSMLWVDCPLSQEPLSSFHPCHKCPIFSPITTLMVGGYAEFWVATRSGGFRVP